MRTRILERLHRVAAIGVAIGCIGAAGIVVADGVSVSVPHGSEAHAAVAHATAIPEPEVVAAIAPAARAQRLFIPPLLTPRVENGTKVFSLTARQGTITRYGETLESAGFNGIYLAPTIRIKRGERIRMDVDNAMDEATTVHWHGLHIAPTGDGGPYQPIAPGATWQPEFTVMQQAATLWYHPHLMGATAPQVGRGMAGMLIVDDANRAHRSLPRRYGVDDLPLILQGAPLPVDGATDGRRPLMVNGTPNAVHRIAAGRVRLRVVNGTGGAILGVSVAGATAMRLVASDGGLLTAPVAGSRFVLGPSERVELVVDMRARARVQLRTTILDDQGPRVTADRAAFLRGQPDPADTGTVLTIVNTSTKLGRLAALPKRLNAAPILNVTGAVQRRMVLGPGIEINGDLMDHDDHELGADMPGTLRIPLGQTEVWTIDNQSNVTHVFHVHDIEFRVLDRNGRAPGLTERGWKDSINVPPGHRARIAMQFTDFADPDNPYMFHCHVLRHEDGGMMGQFVVVPA